MSDRRDPYRGYNFKLEIDGVVCAGFREASGLGEELRPIACKPKYNNITLKWGVTDDHSLLKWGDRSIDGKTQRKSGSIILMDEDRPVQVWTFKGTVPESCRVSELT
jgi:phage tail-like protein